MPAQGLPIVRRGLLKQIEVAAIAAGYRLLSVQNPVGKTGPNSGAPTHWLVKPAAAKPIRVKRTVSNSAKGTPARADAYDTALGAAGFTVTTVAQLSDATPLLV